MCGFLTLSAASPVLGALGLKCKKKNPLLFALCPSFISLSFFSYCPTTNISTWKHINFVCFFFSLILHRPLIPTHNNIICFFLLLPLGLSPFFLVCLFLFFNTVCVRLLVYEKKREVFNLGVSNIPGNPFSPTSFYTRLLGRELFFSY